MTRNEMRRYKEIKFQITELTKELDGLKKEILDEVEKTGENNRHWQDIGYIVSDRHTTFLDTKALKAAFPDIYDMFVRETVSKVIKMQ